MDLSGGGVVVVGAGAAGLAASTRLRSAGISVHLLEAADRIGGRAWTERPAPLAGAVFDHGATWLHAADRNPLAARATAEDDLRNSDAARTERVFVEGRPARAPEIAAYHRAWERLDSVTRPFLEGPDVSLAVAMAPMADDPWAGTIATWEGAIIAAADADALSLQDWHRNTLEGPNLVPPAGVGTLVARQWATPAELGTAVTEIDWSGPGVRVTTSRGTLAADACIVTVSTGVLAADAIRFQPALPYEVRTAIERLPMGLLTKIALPAPAPQAAGLTADTLLVERDGRLTVNGWPLGRRYLTGFVGGRLAWSLAQHQEAAAALVRETVQRLIGLRLPGPAVVTDWATDKLHRGAYAYAGPGDAGQRHVLGQAFVGERIVFAGEAVATDGLAGTVGGALNSGRLAAERLLDATTLAAASTRR